MHLSELQQLLSNYRGDQSLFEKAKQYSIDYMESVQDREVYPGEASLTNLEQFDESLQDLPGDPHEVLEMLHTYGSPATVAQTGGRYFGFVNGSILPSALATKWLSDTWDQNPALYVISPIAAKLEMICERWLVELLGLPEGTAAGFVSGTSTATLCGLAAGRDALLAGVGWNIHEKGLMGAPEIKVVVGDQAHATVFKALSLLGLGRECVIKVPTDQNGCMRPDQLPSLDNRTLLILQAGNVNSGGFDPFGQICTKAREGGTWTHVDGAFGLWAACSNETRHLTNGVELANSWSVDAHKTLNAPYDCGIILCRDRESLINSMQASGSYILYSDKRDGMLYSPEMSRRARGVDLWATLKGLGRKGVDALVTGLHQRARQIAEELQEEGFQILNRVVFNQVIAACDNDELTQKTIQFVQEEGVCWVGGAKWKNKDVIRISVCSWATREEDISLSVQALVAARIMAIGAG